MKKFEGICPCCQKQMTISGYRCKRCGIEVTGDFEKSVFFHLDSLQLKFAEIFLKNRGNIKEVEKELGISYPSVKKLLDNLVSSMENALSPEKKDAIQIPKVVIANEKGKYQESEES